MSAHRRLRQRFFPAGEPCVNPVPVTKTGGDVPAEIVDLRRRMTESPRGDPHGPAQRHGLDRSGLRHPEPLVTPDHLEAHLVPPYGTEIQVYVRWVLALLVHEALEEQTVRERLEPAQTQAIRDQAVRGASPARNRDAPRLRYLPGLVREEKVRREPQRIDARQLPPEPGFDLLDIRPPTILPVPSPGPRNRQPQQHLPRRLAWRQDRLRHVNSAGEIHPTSAPPGEPDRIRQGLGIACEQTLHLFRRPQMQTVGGPVLRTWQRREVRRCHQYLVQPVVGG